jgi:hypothetical protein
LPRISALLIDFRYISLAEYVSLRGAISAFSCFNLISASLIPHADAECYSLQMSKKIGREFYLDEDTLHVARRL